MNDTVKQMMNLADEYANTYRWAGGASANNKRQVLEAELVKLCTPIPAEYAIEAIEAVEPIPSEQITDHIRSMDIDLREDLCAFSFIIGVRWAEKQHGIGGG